MSDLSERHQHLMDRFLDFFEELTDADKKITALEAQVEQCMGALGRLASSDWMANSDDHSCDEDRLEAESQERIEFALTELKRITDIGNA